MKQPPRKFLPMPTRLLELLRSQIGLRERFDTAVVLKIVALSRAEWFDGEAIGVIAVRRDVEAKLGSVYGELFRAPRCSIGVEHQSE